jgi:ATP-dependent DNA helicase DinG
VKPSDLRLPYPAWRPHQLETLVELACRDEPYLLLEAPTGTGKSALAVGLGRLIGEKTVILTGTRQLQTQYCDSLPDLKQAMGRGNFACNIEPSRTAAEARCTVGGQCNRKGQQTCTYYGQKLEAQEAPEAVLNYAYWLALANYSYQFRPLDLLVCDEAHVLEDEVRRFASATFRKSAFKGIGEPWPREFIKWAARFREQNSRQYAEFSRQAPEDLDSDEQRWRRAFKSIYEAAMALSNPACGAENWVAEDQPWGVIFRPVWVSPLVPKYVLGHAKKILFLSATILDKGLFCHQLGIPEEQAAFIRAPSTFPVKSRPLYYQPVGRVKSEDDAALERLVESLDRILDQHPNERGLVHTVSYRLTEYLMRSGRHQGRLLTHDNQTKADVLDRFKNQPGAVLVSPSVTTGVDLPYDLCRFQVIAKLAFPNLGDKQIKQRMKTGPDGLPNPKGQGWYNWATACSLVQAYGRGMRAEDDSCETYLLDGNWDWFRHTVRDMLPEWFTEAIKVTRKTGPSRSIEDVLRQFSKIA